MMAGKKGKKWMDAAYELGQRTGTWSAIEVGTPADDEWGRYFDSIGFTPHVVRMKRSGGIPSAYTMPVALPSELPSTFEPFGPKQRSWSY
jgi:hypothetical protein